MGKEELLGELRGVHYKFLYLLLGYGMLAQSEDARALAIQHGMRLQDPLDGRYREIDVAGFLAEVGRPDVRGVFLDSVEKSLRRMLLNESFEWLKYYCDNTDQVDALYRQSWYGVAYQLRNVGSHMSNVMGRWPAHLSKLGIDTVSWRDKTFRKSMENQELSYTMSNVECLDMWDEQYAFARHVLT